eukprot:scaffold4685_cov234-Chaetoceros_neogracile.AAC.1
MDLTPLPPLQHLNNGLKDASIKMMEALTINKPSNDLALAKEKEKGNKIAELYMKNKADNDQQKTSLMRENNNNKNTLMRKQLDHQREQFDHQKNALKERKLTSDEQQQRIKSLQAEAKDAYLRYAEAKKENFDVDVIKYHWDDWMSIKEQIRSALK